MFVLLLVLIAAEIRSASLFIITLDFTASIFSQTSTMTGSTPTATEADLQKQILQENFLILWCAEERAKCKNEYKEEKHCTKIAALTGIIFIYDESKNEIISQILEIFKYFFGILKMCFFAIFENKFNFYNFYKLQILHANEDFNTQQISISKKNNFQIQKLKNKLKNYSIFYFI